MAAITSDTANTVSRYIGFIHKCCLYIYDTVFAVSDVLAVSYDKCQHIYDTVFAVSDVLAVSLMYMLPNLCKCLIQQTLYV